MRFRLQLIPDAEHLLLQQSPIFWKKAFRCPKELRMRFEDPCIGRSLLQSRERVISLVPLGFVRLPPRDQTLILVDPEPRLNQAPRARQLFVRLRAPINYVKAATRVSDFVVVSPYLRVFTRLKHRGGHLGTHALFGFQRVLNIFGIGLR